MKSLLFRTGSGSILVEARPVADLARHSVSLSFPNNGEPSPRISLQMEMSRGNIRRSVSEPNLTRSEIRTVSKLGSQSFTAPRIPEVPANGVPWEELGSPGGGMNKNRKSGGGGNGGNGSDADRHSVGAYYQEMLKSDPTNALLLRNYGKYLHEVVGDVVKAEEYYGRAILASPGDGEVLSLFGKLIWETQRDESRARSYFNQAMQASPDDCMVLGSYAHFLWEAEEEDEEMERGSKDDEAPIATMVEAF